MSIKKEKEGTCTAAWNTTPSRANRLFHPRFPVIWCRSRLARGVLIRLGWIGPLALSLRHGNTARSYLEL